MADPVEPENKVVPPAAAPEPKPADTPPAVPEPKVEPEKLTISEPQHMADELASIVTGLGFDLKEVDDFTEKYGALPNEVVTKLKEKYGEAAANMILAQIDAQKEQAIAATKAEDTAMFNHLSKAFEGITEQSGEETWNELKDWAQANLGDEKAEINAMLAQGGFVAQKALDHMVEQFKASNDFTQEAKLMTGDNTNNEHVTDALDKAGYDRELRELTNKGFAYDSPEVQKLQTRRMKSIKRGN